MKIKEYSVTTKNGKPVKILACMNPLLINIDDYESYCGAGKGFGDTIIPDKIWGAKVSPACWAHDFEWAQCPATWDAYHAANSRFLHNLQALVVAQSCNWLTRNLRLLGCQSYYRAVDTFGAVVFWRLKNNEN